MSYVSAMLSTKTTSFVRTFLRWLLLLSSIVSGFPRKFSKGRKKTSCKETKKYGSKECMFYQVLVISLASILWPLFRTILIKTLAN